MVAIVAARYFQNHYEWALCILIKLGDIPPLSVSRFNCAAKKEKFFVWRLHFCP
jgi:hypothetical protein